MIEKNRIHLVPAILKDKYLELFDNRNTPEVSENFAQQFEAIRDFCNDALNKHYQSRKKVFPKVRSAGLRGTKALGEALLKK